MGRPKGSKNRKKVVELTPEIPLTTELSPAVTSSTVDIRELATPIEQLENPQTSSSPILRVTNEQYDERFYYSELHVNSRTGGHWFPAYHFLMSMGAPMSEHLLKWYKDLGHEADRVMKQKEVRGSWIHEKVEKMTNWGVAVKAEEIATAWGNTEKDMLFVQRALTGLLNFIEDEQAVIVSSEKMIIAEDWAGTMDLELKLKRDGYKSVWVVDIKTAQAVYEEHKQQVECYRRAVGADRGGVLLLGNSTKKRYTFSEVSPKKSDYYFARFEAIKNLAYVDMTENNRLEPTKEEFPTEFKIISYVPSESNEIPEDRTDTGQV